MAASRRKSQSLQNLNVGTLSPLPGSAGIIINGDLLPVSGILNGVAVSSSAVGLPSNDAANSFSVSRGTSSLRCTTGQLGANATATVVAVAIGKGANSAAVNGEALGYGAVAAHQKTTVVGSGSTAGQPFGTTAGFNSWTYSMESTNLGSNSVAASARCTSVGHNNAVNEDYAVIIGSHGTSMGVGVYSLGTNTVPLAVHETKEGHVFRHTPYVLTATPTYSNLKGGILTYHSPDPLTVTLPTAALFVAGIRPAALAGTGIRCTIVNNSPVAVTISAGGDVNWTLADSTSHVIAANSTRLLVLVKSSAPNAATPTATLYM